MPGGGQTGPPKLSRYDIDSANAQRVADLLAVSGPTTVARLLTLRSIGDVSESKLRRALALLESVGRVRSTAPQQRHGHRLWSLDAGADSGDDELDRDSDDDDAGPRRRHSLAAAGANVHPNFAWCCMELHRRGGLNIGLLHVVAVGRVLSDGQDPARLVDEVLDAIPSDRRDLGARAVGADCRSRNDPRAALSELRSGWVLSFLEDRAGIRHPDNWSTDYSRHTEPTRQQREYARALEPADF